MKTDVEIYVKFSYFSNATVMRFPKLHIENNFPQLSLAASLWKSRLSQVAILFWGFLFPPEVLHA